eukprot:GHVT01023631.1.p1 GENE.GHVT01023631.1~~GHVT01023631.1.p1  ORF type:complete len:253 (-),score=-8.92 GHVT01023631.1:1148-1906(-)
MSARTRPSTDPKARTRTNARTILTTHFPLCALRSPSFSSPTLVQFHLRTLSTTHPRGPGTGTSPRTLSKTKKTEEQEIQEDKGHRINHNNMARNQEGREAGDTIRSTRTARTTKDQSIRQNIYQVQKHDHKRPRTRTRTKRDPNKTNAILTRARRHTREAGRERSGGPGRQGGIPGVTTEGGYYTFCDQTDATTTTIPPYYYCCHCLVLTSTEVNNVRCLCTSWTMYIGHDGLTIYIGDCEAPYAVLLLNRQ